MQRFRASFMAQVYQFAHILVDIKSKFNISFISGKSLEYNAIQDPNISTEEKQELQDKIKQIHWRILLRKLQCHF